MDVKVPHTMHPGTIRVPASKSLAQRFILAAALASKPTTLYNIGQSADVLHMLEVAQNLGAKINARENGVEIIPAQKQVSSLFNSGESGLGVRLLLPVLAAKNGKFTIKGQGSLNKRPLTEIIRFLMKNGVSVTSDDLFLPITLEGKLRAGKLQIDGSTSSQYVSGLLMALPLCEGDSELHVSKLSSKPYVDLTLDVLKKYGIEVQHSNYEKFTIAGNQVYTPQQDSFIIEGDYSGAANWIIAGALSEKPVHIEGLSPHSFQGDAVLLEVVKNAGAIIRWDENQLIISKGKNMPFHFDATDCPDLFPPLVVLAAAAKGSSSIRGINRLIHKESNRALTLQHEFGKLGLKILFADDTMLIEGNGSLSAGTVHSNNDHRIAMASAVAALLTHDAVTVQQAEAVTKSYPEFWVHCGIK